MIIKLEYTTEVPPVPLTSTLLLFLIQSHIKKDITTSIPLTSQQKSSMMKRTKKSFHFASTLSE